MCISISVVCVLTNIYLMLTVQANILHAWKISKSKKYLIVIKSDKFTFPADRSAGVCRVRNHEHVIGSRVRVLYGCIWGTPGLPLLMGMYDASPVEIILVCKDIYVVAGTYVLWQERSVYKGYFPMQPNRCAPI